MNVYAQCPEMENERFFLRLVTQQDCDDLWKVYSDAAAVPLFNSDNCDGDDFHYQTRERMMQGIRFWRWSYEHGCFVRWSILDKGTGCAVGTVELFHRISEDSYNHCAVLRLDLRSDYEREGQIADILALLFPQTFAWFDCNKVITKAKPMAAERIQALTSIGFVSGDAPLIGNSGIEYWDYWVKALE